MKNLNNFCNTYRFLKIFADLKSSWFFWFLYVKKIRVSISLHNRIDLFCSVLILFFLSIWSFNILLRKVERQQKNQYVKKITNVRIICWQNNSPICTSATRSRITAYTKNLGLLKLKIWYLKNFFFYIWSGRSLDNPLIVYVTY